MFHNFQAITLYSLLAALAFALPSRAGEGEPKREPTAFRNEPIDDKKITAEQEILIAILKAELHKLETGLPKDLHGSVRNVGKDVQGLKNSVGSMQADITNIRSQQIDLKAQLDSQKAMIDQLMEDRKRLVINSSPAPSIDRTSVDEIRLRLGAIENALAKIPTTEKRLSMYGPTATGARVMLVNHYSDDLLFIVNGTHYRIAAGRSKALENIPTGTVNMEVFSGRHGMLDQQAATLLAGETFTLVAFRR